MRQPKPCNKTTVIAQTPQEPTEDTTNKPENIADQRTVTTTADIQVHQPEPQPPLIEMDEVKIQQQMTNFVSEFSGDEIDETQTSNSLLKFIGTADMVYARLKTNEERTYFNEIIKFKLTGTAFTRINRRQIKDYETLKTTLYNMYMKTLSLNELERKFNEIRQQFGEPIRKYGYRLSKALQQYKSTYKQKYQIDNLDDSPNRHLTSVDIFKRGLTNTILKETIITIKTEI